MRNNLKHLLLGMSLGAVVVFVYGINKLTPFAQKQSQTPRNEASIETGQTSVEELLKSKIVNRISINLDKEVEFLNTNKLYNTNPEKNKTDEPQIAVINSLTPEISESIETKIDNPIAEIVKPEVAFYIYENPETQSELMGFYQLQTSFVSEEDEFVPTPTPKPTPTVKSAVAYNPPSTTPTNQESNSLGAPKNIVALIERYAEEYGVDTNMMVGIAKCESGFRENAVNGPYAGIYQFVSGTWVSNRRAMGLDENLELRYNAEESIKTAAFKMGRDGFGAWPVCQYKAQGLVASAESI